MYSCQLALLLVKHTCTWSIMHIVYCINANSHNYRVMYMYMYMYYSIVYSTVIISEYSVLV